MEITLISQEEDVGAVIFRLLLRQNNRTIVYSGKKGHYMENRTRKVRCDGCGILCVPQITTYEPIKGKDGLYPKKWCSRKCLNKRLDEIVQEDYSISHKE